MSSTSAAGSGVVHPRRGWPRAGHDLDAGIAARCKADLFQRIERRLMNPSDVGLVSGLYCPPERPGRTGRIFSASGDERSATRGRPSAGPSRSRNCAFLSHHSSPNGAVVVCCVAPVPRFRTRGTAARHLPAPRQHGEKCRQAYGGSLFRPAPAPPSGRTSASAKPRP